MTQKVTIQLIFQLLMKIHNLKKFRDHLYLINLAKKETEHISNQVLTNKQNTC